MNEFSNITLGSHSMFECTQFKSYFGGYTNIVKTADSGDCPGGAVACVIGTGEESIALEYGEFSNCTSVGSGAVFHLENAGSITFTYSAFEDNECTGGDGGALYLQDVAKPKFVNVTCDGNTAAGNGGCMYVNEQTVGAENFTLDNGYFTNNTASAGNGGAIYISGEASSGNQQQITLEGLTFSRNSASGDGGALYVTEYTEFVFYEVYATANHADGNGGVLSSDCEEVILQEVTFDNNSAGGNGGCLDTDGVTAFEVIAGQFDHNSAGGKGGDFHFTLTMSLLMNPDYMILDAEFSGSSAGSDGGSIYLTVPFVNISGCSFTNCSSGGSGGAVYLTKPKGVFSSSYTQLDLSGTEFKNCSAVQYAGGLYTEYLIVDLQTAASPCTFNQCTCGAGGCGMMAEDIELASWVGEITQDVLYEFNSCGLSSTP
ncbi:hypothetical protein ADUPG1_000992, partial [Aduncisulcus paluster]